MAQEGLRNRDCPHLHKEIVTVPIYVPYEEQSHLLNAPGVPFESAKDYLLPNSQLGGYDGGVGEMQVSGAVGEKYGYTKKELARDSRKNIDAGAAYLSSFLGSPSSVGRQYNGSVAYGQRIQAQMNNPDYNTNVVRYALIQVIKYLKKEIAKKK